MTRARPLWIGAFVAGALALAVALAIALGGGRLARSDRVVMHFGGSIYGLQVGAPVMFRGVQVGRVASIEVVWHAADARFSIPVVAELDRCAVRGLDGLAAGAPGTAVIDALVQRGLVAQLSMQSLVTGLLYVELDLRPDRPAVRRGTAVAGLVEIPTQDTAIQALKNQLDTVDVRKLLDDVGAIAASARAIATGPQLNQALDDLREITASVRRMSTQLERRIGPLADAGTGAAAAVTDASGRLGAASDRLAALLDPQSPLVARLQASADEVSRAAEAVRTTAGPDAPLPRQAERALGDLSRAARAMRELADALERQPDAILRGRREEE